MTRRRFVTLTVLSMCSVWMPARVRRRFLPTSIDLERLYNDYLRVIDRYLNKTSLRPVPILTGPDAYVAVAPVLERPTAGDLVWFIAALAHEQRCLFLAGPLK